MVLEKAILHLGYLNLLDLAGPCSLSPLLVSKYRTARVTMAKNKNAISGRMSSQTVYIRMLIRLWKTENVDRKKTTMCSRAMSINQWQYRQGKFLKILQGTASVFSSACKDCNFG